MSVLGKKNGPALKKIIIATGVLLIALSSIFNLDRVSSDKGDTPANEQIYLSKYIYPEGNDRIISHISSLLRETRAECPRTEVLYSMKLGDGSIDFGNDKKLNDDSASIKKKIIKEIESAGHSTAFVDYGGDISKIVPNLQISVSMLEAATLDNIEHYVCGSCGKTFDGDGVCKKCGGEPVAVYKADYNLSAMMKDVSEELKADSEFAKCFPIRVENVIGELIDGAFNAYFSVSDLRFDYSDIEISAAISRKVDFEKYIDTLTSLRLSFNANVSCVFRFKGELASFGEVPCSFTINESASYDFSCLGLKLDTHLLKMPLFTKEHIGAIVSAPEGTLIKWSSDNEEAVRVNDKGYVKTGAVYTARPVFIRAEFELDGKVYYDECEVHIIAGSHYTGLRN